ncbi:YrhB domain-containing protein [Burkholderia latens]|uniref:YrhB domain-containing protein n=1 Tax=Burkholderia latens TaxID=488446 RepID=UPI0009E786A5|nr:YrhB domain-containing protein [Burkholderia latens]
MELTAEQAKEVAQRAITKAGWEGCDAVVVDEYTQEFDVGWVFYYQSARFLETGEFGFSLVGNAPIFVSRVGEYSPFISYLRPVVESIDAYRACGDANACKEQRIRFKGWLDGANKVEAVSLIRQYSHLRLAEAKHAVDRCLSSSSEVLVDTRDVASANQLVLALAKIGLIGTVTYRGFDPTNGR